MIRRFALPLLSALAALAAVGVAACGDDAPATAGDDDRRGDGGSGSDATVAADATPPGEAGAPTWESVEPISDDGTVVVEKVSYRSQGLLIFGVHCRPKAPGKYKALVMNHGGFGGVGGFNGSRCSAAVRNGYVVVESSYRGEDGSEGKVEVCLGEVDDVLAIVEVTRHLPHVDPQKISMLGYSHGGCITTRAVQRGARVQAAVDVFGPKDLAADYDYWKALRDADAGGGAGNAVFEELMRLLREVTGGTPQEQPAAYAARSPIHFAADLDAFPGPYMAVHGTKDALVPARDTCRFAAAAKNVKSYRIDGTLAVATTDPPGCEAAGVTWLPGPKPAPAWPDARYAVVYDEAGHELTSPAGAAMHFDGLGFLVAKIP